MRSGANVGAIDMSLDSSSDTSFQGHRLELSLKLAAVRVDFYVCLTPYVF